MGIGADITTGLLGNGVSPPGIATVEGGGVLAELGALLLLLSGIIIVWTGAFLLLLAERKQEQSEANPDDSLLLVLVGLDSLPELDRAVVWGASLVVDAATSPGVVSAVDLSAPSVVVVVVLPMMRCGICS